MHQPSTRTTQWGPTKEKMAGNVFRWAAEKKDPAEKLSGVNVG
jgi:hypothetical protein